MHIAVNTRLLLPDRLDGIGWFTHEVLSRITRDLPEIKFTFLFDRAFNPGFIYNQNVTGEVLFPQARHPLLYRWYFERAVPKALAQTKADLFFSPDGFLSTRTQVKQIPVIHDLNFEHRPQDLPLTYRKYYRHYFPKFAAKAHKIITVSQFSADDIAQTYHIGSEKITVAHNGYNPAYKPLKASEVEKARTTFASGTPYFIFVGNFSFRKNIHGILSAFEHYKNSGGRSKLLLVGNPLWRYAEMEDTLKVMKHKSEVIFTGRLNIEKLVSAMGGAQALLFPSFFEGFGIPVLEAFAAGVPVITSNTSSLPEVAGNAALYSNPNDFEKISAHMHQIEKSDSQRHNLIESGFSQLKSFSWDNTANKVKTILLDSLERKV